MERAPFAWLTYQPLLDSALPIGGFAHSFGLETFVQQQRMESLDTLEQFIRTMLYHAWAPFDCLLIKEVYRLAGSLDVAVNLREDYQIHELLEQLWMIDHQMHVQRVARETREGMQKIGRRLLQLGREMYPHLPWQQITNGVDVGKCPASYPFVHGWLSYQLDVSLDIAAEGYLYNSVLNTINSALRLMSLGQTQGHKLLIRLVPDCSFAWHAHRERAFDEAYTVCPDAEIAMMQHEHLYSRLFMS
jgi:urease accessory protein